MQVLGVFEAKNHLTALLDKVEDQAASQAWTTTAHLAEAAGVSRLRSA